MKLLKTGRFLGIILLLSLILIAIPVSPALAAYDTALTPTSGQVGDTIAITGSNFPASTLIYFCFSNQAALINQYIGTDVTTYSTVASTTTTTSGTLSTSFVVPSKFSTNNADITPGTYYLYPTVFTSDVPPRQLILNSITFNVVGGNIALNPTIGIVDSPVVITGDSFAPSQTISITFGGSAISIEQGNTSTDSSGDFSSTILVPEGKAGVHDVVVTVSGYSSTAQFTIEPDILVFPQSGEVGNTISISGTGFARRSVILIYFNSTPTAAQALTDTDGNFDIASFEIPDLGLAQGSYLIEAEDDELNLAVGSFTLVSSQPTTTPPTTTPPTTTTAPPTKTTELSITSSGHTPGSLVGIGGAGFTPGGTATVSFDSTLVATAQIDEAGLLMVTFEAPPAAGGDHIITVTDGVNTDQITYTMESTTLSNPVIQKPKSGDKVKKPITFDWDDVTSTSPVTYTLYVSSDSLFSADSILIEKTGLAVSTCQLTEEEEIDFVGRDEPYYWRVKAVDAVQNESPWSGPFEFYVSPPFSFPTWATITLAIVGGILLFGLGYWLGRRTAFFY